MEVREKRQLRTSEKTQKLCVWYILIIMTVTHLLCPCALLGGRKSDGIIVIRVPAMEIVHDPGYNRVTLSLHDHHQSCVLASQLQVHLTTWILFLHFKFSSPQPIVKLRWYY